MLTWAEFEAAAPELAEAGRSQLYRWGLGMGFLATVRPDGGPRVHPVCPAVSADGLLVLVVDGPKQHDLLRDGRYSLHGETFAPPRHDDGFSISGIAREVTDPAVKVRFGEQLRVERKVDELWPSFEDDKLFELLIDRALLMLTEATGPFPQGPTVWRVPTP